MTAPQAPVCTDIQARAAPPTQRPSNFQEDGQWVGAFKTGDRVRTPSGRVGTVTTCFGYREFGYAYIVTYGPDTYAHLSEWQLELAPLEESNA